MMKLGKIILGVVVCALIGSFAFIALTDVPVQQSNVEITLDNERFFNAN